MTRDPGLWSTTALVFVASAAGTILWCGSMSDGGMPMPGGWTMSMAWMRMPGQTWLAAAGSFLGMWVLMMVAMMLPSLTAMLAGYRRTLRRSQAHPPRLGILTALAGAGCFLAWTLFGAAAYPLGVALAAAEMRWPALSRSVPVATGVILLLAGCLQLTAWKMRQLRCCRDAPECWPPSPPEAGSALRVGLRLGRHCALCCSGYMTVLLVTGVMDLGIMFLIMAAITAERLFPRPEITARVAAAAVLVAGTLLIAASLGRA